MQWHPSFPSSQSNPFKMSNDNMYMKGKDVIFSNLCDDYLGSDIQQREYAVIEAQSGVNEPPVLAGDAPMMYQNLSTGKDCDLVICPGEDIQQPEYKTMEAQSGQENSSSSKSIGSKKRKLVAKGKGKEKIQRRKQRTFYIAESSNSKHPEKLTKKADRYEDLIKHKDVGESARVLLNRVNNRTKSVRDIQLQCSRLYEQIETPGPLRARLLNLMKVMDATEAETERIKQEIRNIPANHKALKLTEVEAKTELIEIEKEKLNKFIQDLQNTRKELYEIRQEKAKKWKKTENLEPIFTDSVDYQLKDQRKKLFSELTHLFQGNITDDPITQKWTQVPQEENVSVEVPTEEAMCDVDVSTTNLMIQYFDGVYY
ncbi:hypothetical protein V6N11_016440 [Hibiscus sabdariffa]|uniref:Uncharacterized protein n=1 Tax=Hibiscus sabdariffa TaxID=183260 RepID=A0ABR2TV86_9ROSI